MTLTLIEQGSFTSTGAAQQINLSGGANYFKTLNYTQAITQQSTGRGVAFEWYSGFSPDYGIEIKKTNSTDALNMVGITSGGFTYVESRPSPEAPKTGTVITQAAGAVCTCTSHGYSVGDRVRIYGNLTMKQIAGMEFTITVVADANTFTLGYLDSSGFAAAETGFTVRRIAKYAPMLPEFHFITKITQATQAVVTFSSTHNYQLGDVIYFRVSSNFGMVEIDQQSANVTAVDTTANTVTVDLNTSAYTAFAFPAASAAPNIIFAIGTVAGKKGLVDNYFATNPISFTLDPFRQATTYPYMSLAAGAQSPAGSTSDVIYWQSFRQENAAGSS